MLQAAEPDDDGAATGIRGEGRLHMQRAGCRRAAGPHRGVPCRGPPRQLRAGEQHRVPVCGTACWQSYAACDKAFQRLISTVLHVTQHVNN